VITIVTVGESLCPHKKKELQPPHRGEKRVNWHHNKNFASDNISIMPLSEEHC
jgi:hypothetical protein